MSQYPFLPTLSKDFNFMARIMGPPGSYGALWKVQVSGTQDTLDSTTVIQEVNLIIDKR